MTKVYMFSYESMCIDLLDIGMVESQIESIADNIIGGLELSKAISVDGTYIIGNITAFFLKERYKIECQEIELI